MSSSGSPSGPKYAFFQTTKKRGRRSQQPLLSCFASERQESALRRVGFVASRGVGNAVLRNRAKRLLREAYQEVEGMVIPGYDIVVVAGSGIHLANTAAVASQLRSALGELSLIADYAGQLGR